MQVSLQCKTVCSDWTAHTHLFLEKHHLALERAAQPRHSDEGLPHSADSAREDIIQLYAVQRVCSLLHGVQRHWVAGGHVNHICNTNNLLTAWYFSLAKAV